MHCSALRALQSGAMRRAPAPDGQITSSAARRLVQPSGEKYSDFPKPQISLYPPPSCSDRGALAIVTDVEQDAVDADAPITNGTEADGEVVWS